MLMCKSGLHWKIPFKFHSENNLLQMGPASTTSTGYKSSMKQNFSKKIFLNVFLY